MGALGSHIAVLARTPSLETVDVSSDETVISADTTGIGRPQLPAPAALLTVVPTVGLLDQPALTEQHFAAADVPAVDPVLPRSAIVTAVSSSVLGASSVRGESSAARTRAERRIQRAEAARERARESRQEARQAARRQQRERRERSGVVAQSGWRMAPSASWYGPGLYGNRTACGFTYTRMIVGVAHRTLPCGTLVQLRWQGQSAVVPVIDRGPFGARSNVFDLSARLACVVLRPDGARHGCFTRHHISWRIVDRRRN